MAKKKKSKTIQLPTSLEAQIRTRARKLEIAKCYISKDWDEMREGNVVITRLHKNGNLTFGFFLVDLALLGVKDALYSFNISEPEFTDMLFNPDVEDEFVEIDYELAHNIIYGAVEYAEDFSFYPCKEYSVAKYILEEDDENIPLLDVEFGIDGIPTVICRNEDPRKKEISILTKSVGIDNFQILNVDEQYDEEDFEEDLLPGWDVDIEELGVPDWGEKEWGDYLDNIEKQLFRVTQYFFDMAFLEEIDEEIDAFAEVLGGAKYKDVSTHVDEGEITAILAIFNAINNEDDEKVSEILEESKNKYPDSVMLNVLAVTTKYEFQSVDETINQMEELRKKHKDNLFFLNHYSAILVDLGLYKDIPKIFNNKLNLHDFNPGREYTTAEVLEFCASYCTYYMAMGDLVKAEPYYEVLDTLNENSYEIKILIQENIFKKMTYLVKYVES